MGSCEIRRYVVPVQICVFFRMYVRPGNLCVSIYIYILLRIWGCYCYWSHLEIIWAYTGSTVIVYPGHSRWLTDAKVFWKKHIWVTLEGHFYISLNTFGSNVLFTANIHSNLFSLVQYNWILNTFWNFSWGVMNIFAQGYYGLLWITYYLLIFIKIDKRKLFFWMYTACLSLVWCRGTMPLESLGNSHHLDTRSLYPRSKYPNFGY